MIGKPIVGKSFGGCIRYVVNRPEAKILLAEGVRVQSADTLIQDFNLQRRMRPELGKAVGHLVLSWSKEDLAKLSDAVMAERAKEYMDKMGIINTQYAIIRHTDREHPHLHVIYNRVDNNGKTITDKNSYARNIKACKEITLKYGYHLGKGKDDVNRQALRGKEKNRYAFYDAIKSSLKTACTWKELEAEIAKHSVHLAYKYRSGTTEVQGISFEKENVKIKGSAVDRNFSYARLDIQLNRNQLVKDYQAILKRGGHSLSSNSAHSSTAKGLINQVLNAGSGKGMIETLLQTEDVQGNVDPAGDTDLARKKQKKRRGHSPSQGISR